MPLDALCDTAASFGDLVILVASIPYNYVLGFYRRWWKAYDPPQADPETWHRDSTPTPAASAAARPSAHRAYASESNGEARPAAKRDISNGSVKQTRSVIQPRSNAPTPNHQIWRPSSSAYDDEDVALNPHSGLPTPPIERQQRMQLASGAIVAPKPVRAGNKAPPFSGIAEDDEAQAGGARSGFRKSLLSPREPRNPGSDGGMSDDDDNTKGVQPNGSAPNDDETLVDEDEEAGDDAEMDGDGISARAPWQDDEEEYESDMDEDVFNTTLATPGRRRGYQEDDSEYEEYLDDTMLTPPPLKMSFSESSAVTQSSTLSTTDAGSSLRTTRSLSSDGSSLAAKKQRAPPKFAGDDDKFSVNVPARKAGAAGKAGSRASTITRSRGKALQAAGEDGDAAAEDETNEDAKQGSGTIRARPKAQRGDSQATIRGPSARGRGASTARGAAAVGRAPSARIAAKERPKPVVKKASGTGAAANGPAKPIGTAAPKVVPKAAKPVQKDAAA